MREGVREGESKGEREGVVREGESEGGREEEGRRVSTVNDEILQGSDSWKYKIMSSLTDSVHKN